MDNGGRYKTCILELVRNNGILQEEKSNRASFLMFDYFDILYYTELKGEEKDYKNYFALGDPFENDKEYKVSYKSLGLYQHWHKIEKQEDPFLSKGGRQLSDKPFLGIVQINLCKESFDGINIGIEGFLLACEEVVEKIAGNICQDAYRCLYRSTNTGDFCLVLRTGHVEQIYQTAMELNGYESDKQKDGFRVKFCTYTSVGLECVVGGDGKYCTLSQGFVNQNKGLRVALRFSASASLADRLGQLNQAQPNRGEYTVKKGVFGRYDYLLHVSIGEFAEIYPILCEKKMGKLESHVEAKTELQKIISEGSVRNINERILVNLGSYKGKGVGTDKSEDVSQEVDRCNKELYEKIIRLWDERNYFSEEYRTFCDLYRGTKELYKAFSSIGLEEDAYINWLIFYQDMETLCGNLNKWIERVKEGATLDSQAENRKWRISTLKNWRNDIQAINEYTQLVQNVNYQNYQSPIYEIQTQSDTEKLLVAYREVMEVYFDSYNKKDQNKKDGSKNTGDSGQKEHIHPIIYPDLSRNNVEVTASFLPIKGVSECERMVVCTVPSFEYFGRLYDLLPWIIHESSHHVRVLSRMERNQFILEYDMRYIFRQVAADILKELSDDKFYGGLGAIEDILAESLMMAFKEEYQTDKLQEYNFENLIKELERHIQELFYMDGQGALLGQPVDTDVMYLEACNALLNEYRSYGKVDGGVCSEFKKLYAKNGGMKLVESLINKILEIYWGEVSELEGISGTVYIKLEDFMIPQSVIEERLVALCDSGKRKPFEHKLIEYAYSVKRLFRVYCTLKELNEAGSKGSESRRNFLNKAGTHYKSQMAGHTDRKVLKDPSVTYALRQLGMQNKNSYEFAEVMEGMLRRIDGSRIWDCHKLRIGTYREACADLFMAISLNMTAFGYCSQVFHTISAARLQIVEYDYENINYARLRVIAAVLLNKENHGWELGTQGELVSVNGEKLLEQGDGYCLYTLKCIQRKLEESEQANSVRKERIDKFFGAMYGQIRGYLKDPDGEAYQSMILYPLLNRGEGRLGSNTRKIWDECRDVVELCQDYKHLFWRIECFLMGLSYIMEKNIIRVEKDIYGYMKKVCEKACGETDFGKGYFGKGCYWENGLPQYLLDLKEGIGRFYNEPELRYTEGVEQKLENTIDFIQNYYYHNRFRLRGRKMHVEEQT